MESQLEDYRSIHNARFLERQKKRDDQVACFDSHVKKLSEVCTNLREVKVLLQEISDFISSEDIFDDVKGKLLKRVHDVVLAINSNPHIKINFEDQDACIGPHEIKELLASIFEDAKDVELQFDMDTTRDEEIARALERELGGSSSRAGRSTRGTASSTSGGRARARNQDVPPDNIDIQRPLRGRGRPRRTRVAPS